MPRRSILAAVPVAVAVCRARRRLGLPPWLSTAVAASAPCAVALGLRPGKCRAAATWAAHMWAYKVAFAAPYDRPERLRRRLRIDPPIRFDEAIGLGTAPGERLQRRLRRPPALSALDWAATLFYFTWELEPHVALAWILLRHPHRFAGSAARLAATFDLTLVGYWAVPTAPPWWASEREGRMSREVRRVTVEVSKAIRGEPRPGVDHNLGANPWAAMPSDHIASAATTAFVLARIDRRLGALAAAYAALMGAVLVYAGEHYVADLLAGLGLALGVDATAAAVER